MKAVIYKKYGPPDVLQLEEVEKPTPKKNQVLIRIYATTVTPSDVMMRSGKFPFIYRLIIGIRNPRKRILGYEFAGKIESIGEDVKLFKLGDLVFGATYFKMSCHAEYICLPETSALAIKPSNLTLTEAATVPDGASTALHFLRKGNIQSGQKVLIYGASGSIGTYAIQLAKFLGAEVTGLCSMSNVELVKSLGADNVIDYTKEDLIQNGEIYDIIFDTVGKSSFSDCIKSLKKQGIYLSTKVNLVWWIRGKWTSLTTKMKVKTGFSMSNSEKLYYLKGLIEEQKLKPVIDRSYELEQLPEAHIYVGKGHKKGNVVITIVDEEYI
ncbi:MAG: NAD(P)-dependent alcohol dehydrogenase [Candidatus Kariarchaeaceae archaeon]